MSSERQLRGFILSRFFMVLIVTSMVEFAIIVAVNRLLIPSTIKFFNLESVVTPESSEKLFLILFVVVATAVVNKVWPFFNVSPDSAYNALLGLLSGTDGSNPLVYPGDGDHERDAAGVRGRGQDRIRNRRRGPGGQRF